MSKIEIFLKIIIVFWSACSTSPPGGNQVDGLPPVVHNGARGEGQALETKTIWADHVFNLHELRILLSQFDEGQKQTSLGTKVSCNASGMPVIIMAETTNRFGHTFRGR